MHSQFQEQQVLIQKLQNKINSLAKQNDDILSGSKIYIPRKFDNIDVALGTFLNSLGQKLKISFIRESHGVYRFGSKRVIINLERGEELHVRIGGQYMHLKQFMD